MDNNEFHEFESYLKVNLPKYKKFIEDSGLDPQKELTDILDECDFPHD